MNYGSEAAKVRDMPHVMKFITGQIVDIGCGPDKITENSFGIDGRSLPGVNFITDMPTKVSELMVHDGFDTVFSSHFLEHIADQYGAVVDWRAMLNDVAFWHLYTHSMALPNFSLCEIRL